MYPITTIPGATTRPRLGPSLRACISSGARHWSTDIEVADLVTSTDGNLAVRDAAVLSYGPEQDSLLGTAKVTLQLASDGDYRLAVDIDPQHLPAGGFPQAWSADALLPVSQLRLNYQAAPVAA